MSRSSVPPPRWQRLTFGLAPMVGLSVLALSAAAVEITASENTVLDVLLLAICIAALIPAVIMAKVVLAAEHYATDEMRSRYETLRALLAAQRTHTPPVNPRAGVVILGVDEPTRTGRDREFVRFAVEDGTAAPDGGEYQVHERFTLHEARPIVLHRVDALSIRTDPDGDNTCSPYPLPAHEAGQHPGRTAGHPHRHRRGHDPRPGRADRTNPFRIHNSV